MVKINPLFMEICPNEVCNTLPQQVEASQRHRQQGKKNHKLLLFCPAKNHGSSAGKLSVTNYKTTGRCLSRP